MPPCLSFSLRLHWFLSSLPLRRGKAFLKSCALLHMHAYVYCIYMHALAVVQWGRTTIATTRPNVQSSLNLNLKTYKHTVYVLKWSRHWINLKDFKTWSSCSQMLILSVYENRDTSDGLYKSVPVGRRVFRITTGRKNNTEKGYYNLDWDRGHMICSGFSRELWSQSFLLLKVWKRSNRGEREREGSNDWWVCGWGRERAAGKVGVEGCGTWKNNYLRRSYGKKQTVASSFCLLSPCANTTAGCCWISLAGRKLHFLASCTQNLDRQLEIDYYRTVMAHARSFFLAIYTLNICVYISVNSFPNWYRTCKQTPPVFITLSHTHMPVHTPTYQCLHMFYWCILQKKMIH